MNNTILERILRALTIEYLDTILLETKDLDTEKLSAGKINSYKKGADRILKSEIFKVVMRSVVEQNKNLLLLKANSEIEVALARGQILALKNLENELLKWAVVSKNSEDIDALDN